MRPAHVRVGEALTKDRKSSAAASDGLVDIVRAARQRKKGGAVETATQAGFRRSSVARVGTLLGMGVVVRSARGPGLKWGAKREAGAGSRCCMAPAPTATGVRGRLRLAGRRGRRALSRQQQRQAKHGPST
jgi:hypothetical protein